jgi:hypothetical protein
LDDAPAFLLQAYQWSSEVEVSFTEILLAYGNISPRGGIRSRRTDWIANDDIARRGNTWIG